MIRFVTGDILETRARFIAQGVATGSQEGLGTGLALKISKRWPEVQRGRLRIEPGVAENLERPVNKTRESYFMATFTKLYQHWKNGIFPDRISFA